MNREWAWGAAAVGLACGLWIADPAGLVDLTREGAFETLGRIFPRSQSSGGVAVIDIDRESLARLGAWPWRRSLLAALVEAAAKEGPRAIAIDVLLSGPDRKGPAALARDLAELSGRADLDPASFEDDDQRLAAAVAAAGNVVLGIVLDPEGGEIGPPPVPLAVEGTPERIAPQTAAGLAAPHEAVAAGAAGFGVQSLPDGPLGRVASAPILTVAAGETYPGLALESVRVAEGAALLVLQDAPRRLMAGGVAVPFDRRAEMRLRFAPPESWSGRTLAAWRVLAGEAGADRMLAGKVVLIGSSAPEAGAFLPAAGAALMPTVQVQADAVDQMLVGRHLVRPDAAPGWEALGMVGLGLAAVALAATLPPAWAAAAAVGLALCWTAAAAFAFRRAGLLVDPIGPPLVILLGANVTAFAAFVRTRTLKNAILQKFARYVPPEVVARLLREPGALRLDGEMREVTALLTDIESFSRMTEAADPRALVAVLDRYFDVVTELVVAHGGMVDKIVGDAVLAFFNIPAPLPGHAEAAVRCARAIVAATEELRRSEPMASMGLGRTRCGVESGPAVVGDVGGNRRLDYTAYGVVVNKAARFQDANKRLKSAICVGPAAAAMLTDPGELRCLGRIEVRGMSEVCEVFEPWPAGASQSARDLYARAVALHESDPGEARRLLREVAVLLPGDPVVAAWPARLGA